MSDDLDSNNKDKIVAATRGALAAVPFAGGLLGELVTEVIPGQRQERIVAYLRALETRVSAMEDSALKTALEHPEKIDLIERGGFQAAHATTQERISNIVEIVSRGLEGDEAETIRRKRLLEIFAQIDEDQVTILTAYGRSYGGGDRNAWDTVSRPQPPTLGSGRAVIEQNQLYDLGKEHLLRLGLLKRNFGTVKKGQIPEFDTKTGAFKSRVEVSYLGKMLLREMGIELPFSD